MKAGLAPKLRSPRHKRPEDRRARMHSCRFSTGHRFSETHHRAQGGVDPASSTWKLPAQALFDYYKSRTRESRKVFHHRHLPLVTRSLESKPVWVQREQKLWIIISESRQLDPCMNFSAHPSFFDPIPTFGDPHPNPWTLVFNRSTHELSIEQSTEHCLAELLHIEHHSAPSAGAETLNES